MKEDILNIYKYFLEQTKDKEVSLELVKEWGIFLREKGRQSQGSFKIPSKTPEMATPSQKTFLTNLNYKGDLNAITKAEAVKEIQNLINIKNEGYL